MQMCTVEKEKSFLKMQNEGNSSQAEMNRGADTISTQVFKERDTYLQNILQIMEAVKEETVYQDNWLQYAVLHQNLMKLKEIDPNWKLVSYYEGDCIRLKHYSCSCF